MTAYQQASHWGTYTVTTEDDGRDVAAVTPWSGDQDPSPLLGNIPGSVTHRARVAGPAVRRGWLDDGPGPSRHRGTGRPGGRGPGDYVQVSWDEVLDRLADELGRVVSTHGNQAIYGGSYGWGSAGRFHHAQSQVHRFLNGLGGYTRSVNSYSTGALEVFLPRIVCPEATASQWSSGWPEIVAHTGLWLAFGGVPAKNTGTNHGGTGDHPTRPSLAAYLARGGRFVGVSPLRDDLPQGATWLAPRPGSDTALLLALCHTLISEGLVATDFVASHTTGYADLEAYVLGESDGRPKDADWAGAICELPAATITQLARDLAGTRSLVTSTWSLQRQEHGEMAIWAVVALAALLGQIGLPGGGFGFGYGSMNEPGLPAIPFRLPTLTQGSNAVSSAIPVAAISDLLLHPGRSMPYDGGLVTFPDIRLVYWAGGNPFHHHQDLGRLRVAMGRPDTVVVHDPYWTPMARHADIVMPSTTAAERDDLTGSRNGAVLVAMHAAVPRHADSRDDYDTFAALAQRLGFAPDFTQGRTSQEWVRHLYEEWRADLAAGRIVAPDTVRLVAQRRDRATLTRTAGGADGSPPAAVDVGNTELEPTADGRGLAAPPYDEFRRLGVLRLPTAPPAPLLASWRAHPAGNPLTTPSGLIELASPEIEAFALADCPGRPTWLPPAAWDDADRCPLHLIANQPRTRLHSQLDHGAASQATKVAGREPIRLHPNDAAERGIADGDLVLVRNNRGRCLAGAVLHDGLRRGVAQLSTGAWYDPADPGPVPLDDDDPPYDPQSPENLDVHGNPNVLTTDRRTSAMAQGTAGQWTMVQVERWAGRSRPVRAHEPLC